MIGGVRNLLLLRKKISGPEVISFISNCSINIYIHFPNAGGDAFVSAILRKHICDCYKKENMSGSTTKENRNVGPYHEMESMTLLHRMQAVSPPMLPEMS